ncbi:MAG: hypothetical protein FD161_3770 [Limisphaerales bacterium]|nr:MAG: hypothetical protein FD161_3770 [Limisphaerales bacterium]KAG0507448.1 MAG: hypothetical protein E1N63_3367 [Limisphaerales bacterium]TXT47931.1 MAG: hypothetical protein FD140_3889 [Limisphaerales bacterium]
MVTSRAFVPATRSIWKLNIRPLTVKFVGPLAANVCRTPSAFTQPVVSTPPLCCSTLMVAVNEAAAE